MFLIFLKNLEVIAIFSCLFKKWNKTKHIFYYFTLNEIKTNIFVLSGDKW